MSGSPARRRGSLAAAGLIGLAALAVTPARAADDGYANVFSSVLGAVGIIKADPPPPIEYRERPPLVLPKAAELPKPAAGSQHSAAWPQDPDVVKHRKELEEARAPHMMSPSASDRGERLSAEELLKGRVAGDDQPVRPNACGNDGQGHNCTVLSPDVLKAENEHYLAANPDKAEALVAGQEPAREWLTQPPKGYMKPVKSVRATTEAPAEKVDDSSARYMQQQEAKKRAAEE